MHVIIPDMTEIVKVTTGGKEAGFPGRILYNSKYEPGKFPFDIPAGLAYNIVNHFIRPAGACGFVQHAL